MKFLSVIPAVLTTSPAVSTCAPLENTTPDWLMSTICPLARIWPAICDGLAPTTRLSVMLAAFGCTYCTVCPAADIVALPVDRRVLA